MLAGRPILGTYAQPEIKMPSYLNCTRVYIKCTETGGGEPHSLSKLLIYWTRDGGLSGALRSLLCELNLSARSDAGPKRSFSTRSKPGRFAPSRPARLRSGARVGSSSWQWCSEASC